MHAGGAYLRNCAAAAAHSAKHYHFCLLCGAGVENNAILVPPRGAQPFSNYALAERQRRGVSLLVHNIYYRVRLFSVTKGRGATCAGSILCDGCALDITRSCLVGRIWKRTCARISRLLSAYHLSP